MILRKKDLSYDDWFSGFTREKIKEGRYITPNIRSANAIFITRYKLFLFRSFLLNAKSAIASIFPMTTATACAEKAKLQAMICAFGKSFVIDENEEEEVLVDTFVIAKFTANSQLSSITCEETESCNDLIQSAPSVGQLLVFYYYYYY